MDNIIFIVILAVAAPAGMIIGYWARKTLASREIDSAEAKAIRLVEEAKSKQKEALLAARDKAIKLIEEAKKEEEKRRGELKNIQARLERREELFDKKLLDFEEKQRSLYEKANKVEKIKTEIKKIQEDQFKKLQEIAKMTREKARELLMNKTEQTIKEDLLERIKKLEKESQEELEKKAKDVLSTVIQRCAADHTTEITTTTVDLPSDEMKGRIIGREGRNIKTIEQLTGVEIIVDDTPEAIVISGFSPIRRHVAKRALEKLISDGRIHPGRIEEAIENAKKDLAKDIKEAGEEAVYEVGITGLDPKLVQIIGRLKYRTSYGQNILRHSVEVAQISGLLAEELGADVATAKKAGLLHDIGKAVDHDIQGTHLEIGRNILKKFKVSEEIIKGMQSHHEDYPFETIESVIIRTADSISGARPGARKDTYEKYLQRLEELEGLANDFDGVEKSYAIQAGREIRIFVIPEKIDDLGAVKLSRSIAERIEEELKYPGEIKVNVIRETRAVEFAK